MKNILLMILSLVLLISCSETNEPSVENGNSISGKNDLSMSTKNEFSIYMLKDTINNSPDEVALDALILEDDPLISLDEIVSYKWYTHQIEYSDAAKEKLKSKESLYKHNFVVTVNGQRIYWGTFIYDIASEIYNNPVINIPSTHEMTQSYITNTISIDRAYPGYFGEESDPDIRENQTIYNVLKKNGKLSKNEFSIYMLKDTINNSPDEVALDALILEDDPLISLDEIVSYKWDTHQIEYSDAAKEKLKSKEPLYRRNFVVKVNGQRIYWGTFIYDIASEIYNNPVINIPSTHGMTQSYIENSFVIDRAYPKYFGEESDPDIRENQIIYSVLKKSGKLS